MKGLRRYFITGLVIVLPIIITVYVLIVALKFFDNILGRFINFYLMKIFGFRVFGLGILLFIALVLIVGILAVNYFGKRWFLFLEKQFAKIPLVRKVYPATKQMVRFLLAEDRTSFKRVVLVEYPRKGIYSIGFVTNKGMKEAQDKINEEILNVLIPSTPSPLTGYFIIVPKREVIFLDISIEESMKLIVSGGILNP